MKTHNSKIMTTHQPSQRQPTIHLRPNLPDQRKPNELLRSKLRKNRKFIQKVVQGTKKVVMVLEVSLANS